MRGVYHHTYVWILKATLPGKPLSAGVGAALNASFSPLSPFAALTARSFLPPGPNDSFLLLWE